MTPTGRTAPPGEDGFVLIEVLVSAIVVAIVAAAVFSLLSASARSAAEERHRSVAFAVAQEDQARLRSMRIGELNRLVQKRTVTVDGTPFTVESTGVFVNDTIAQSSSCVKGSSSNDYVKVLSQVTWPSIGSRPPASIQSIISPANGSLDPTHGNLTITIKNGAGLAIPGISLSGTGPATFTGATDVTGCANFADLPSGTYSVTPSGLASGLVDKDGKAPGAIPAGVVAGGTTPLALQYDVPGGIGKVTFKARTASGGIEPTTTDSIVVSNSGMTEGKVFGTPGGTRVAAIEKVEPLFPFAPPNADTVYAGSCGGDNPNPNGETGAPGEAATASALIPSGGKIEKVEFQMPSLEVTVKSGSSVMPGARITISDDKCNISGSPVKRIYTSNASGKQSNSSTGPIEYGMPWSVYDICASLKISGNNRRNYAKNVVVQSLTTNATATIDLSGSGSESGTCP